MFAHALSFMVCIMPKNNTTSCHLLKNYVCSCTLVHDVFTPAQIRTFWMKTNNACDISIRRVQTDKHATITLAYIRTRSAIRFQYFLNTPIIWIANIPGVTPHLPSWQLRPILKHVPPPNRPQR